MWQLNTTGVQDTVSRCGSEPSVPVLSLNPNINDVVHVPDPFT